MLIDRIELFHVAMPLTSPWRTAYGEDPAIQSVLVRMSSGSVEAWGESAPLAAPCYSPEWAGGVFAVVRDWLAPAILGKDIQSGEELQSELAIFKGNPFGKAALDSAWWALHAKATGLPLHKALGATRDVVPVGADFGVADRVEDLLAQVSGAVERGFPRVKLKFGPGWDLPVLRAVRERFPKQTIHIDCNGAYRISDLPFLRELDDFALAMIEQPLQHDDLLDHAKLQSEIETPVCLDESITHVRAVEQALALGSCKYVNVKPGRVGGLTNAVAIHDLCREAGIPCWVGSMLESATGAGQLVALAMLENFSYPADIFPSTRLYTEDLGVPPIELDPSSKVPSVKALLTLPEPDPRRLPELTLQSVVLKT